MNERFERILATAVEKKASDIHLTADEPAVLRIDGALVRQEETAFEAAELETLLLPLIDDFPRAALQDGSLPSAQTQIIHNGFVFNVLIFRARGTLAATVRILGSGIPEIDEIGGDITPLLHEIVGLPRGLVLFTGTTGSGKQTVACSVLDAINQNNDARIYTIEESPAYHFVGKKSVVTSLFVGQDVESHEKAAQILYSGADPDVVYFSDLPTVETARQAMLLADTGHLVLAALAAESAAQAVVQLLNAFPEPRAPVGDLLARTLFCVTNQRLLRRADRPGRLAAYEILRATPEVQTVLRGDTASMAVELSEIMKTGTMQMRTLSQAARDLVTTGQATEESARPYLEG